MAILRLFIAGIYFFTASIVSLFIFIFHPGSAKNIRLFAKVMAFIPRKIFNLKIEIEGKEFLDNHRPCIFISNHQDSMDFLTCVAIEPKYTVSLGKKSLKYIPLFGQLYWLSGNILIDRANHRKSFETTKLIGEKINKEKLSIWIFPEGTRNYGKGLLPFKNGAFKIAHNNQIPIIPVCISTYNFNLSRFRSGTIRIKMLPPVEVDDVLSTRQKIQKLMEETIKELDQRA